RLQTSLHRSGERDSKRSTRREGGRQQRALEHAPVPFHLAEEQAAPRLKRTLASPGPIHSGTKTASARLGGSRPTRAPPRPRTPRGLSRRGPRFEILARLRLLAVTDGPVVQWASPAVRVVWHSDPVDRVG